MATLHDLKPEKVIEVFESGLWVNNSSTVINIGQGEKNKFTIQLFLLKWFSKLDKLISK
jgi:hypothetical protein